MIFTVSVVIPAYNVALFVEKAINSVLDQREVIEVLVVDDGSTDETIRIVEKIQSSNSKVKLFQHEHGINKGRSATRNLAIQKATGNYIAFLDADDFYLINRFKKDKEILEKNPYIDGVYNAVGIYFYREPTILEQKKLTLNTVSKKLEPSELFDGIISSKYGLLHLNGLTVKKVIFDTVGLFNEALVVAEDSDILFKMALKCNLNSGILTKAVAKRGIHETNVFGNENLYKIYNLVFYEGLVKWCFSNSVAISKIDIIFKYYWIIRYREKKTLRYESIYWLSYLSRTPKVLFSYLSIKYFPVIRNRQMLFPFLFKK